MNADISTGVKCSHLAILHLLLLGLITGKKPSKISITMSYRKAHMKILMIGRPALPEQFSKQIRCAQEGRRKALVIQLSCLHYLLRQGLAVRDHNDDSQGNLRQLVQMLGNISDPCVVDWI